MKKRYNDEYSYEVFDNGYVIYKNDEEIIEQFDPFGHVFLHNGTYEENALYQLDEISSVPDPEPAPYVPTEEEKLRADIDYLAIMADVELPSQGGEL